MKSEERGMLLSRIKNHFFCVVQYPVPQGEEKLNSVYLESNPSVVPKQYKSSRKSLWKEVYLVRLEKLAVEESHNQFCYFEKQEISKFSST